MRRLLLYILVVLLVTNKQCVGSDQQATHPAVQSYNECVRLLNAPRVALLFLIRDDLFHRELWRQWLSSATGFAPMASLVWQSNSTEQAADTIIATCLNATAANTFPARRQYLFSVHTHLSPGVPLDYDAQLGGELLPEEERVPTNWGGTNLVEATRRLLQHALKDPLNHFFVLLSETSIPLYPPLVVYQQLLHRNTSAVNACPWSGGAPDIQRYEESLADAGLFDRSQWRKSCQFVGLLRSHAEVVASDNPLWRAYEERCPGATLCFADEHYIPLALSLHNLEHETDCFGHLTYTNWGQDASPALLQGNNVTAPHIASLRAGQGSATTHCAPLAMQPPSVDLAAFAFLSHTRGIDVVEAAERGGGAGWGVAAPVDVMHAHCPMFARKFPASERHRVLHALQEHPMNVLPDAVVSMRRYNAGGRRARFSARFVDSS